MTKKVILVDNDNEELIPYTELATSNSAGRVRPDGTTLSVNASGVISINGVTATELGYLSGVTSNIQTQINNSVQQSGNETIGGVKTFTSSPVVPIPASSDNSQQSTNTSWVNSKIDSVLDSLYPVGAIYIGTQATCPLATLISGSTWVLVSSGRVLQGADNDHNAGTTIEAGLPNITGDVGENSGIGHVSNTSFGLSVHNTDISGAFYANNNCEYTATRQVQQGNDGKSLGFDASRSSSIYGNSNTVQPPAYVVNIWRRTA